MACTPASRKPAPEPLIRSYCSSKRSTISSPERSVISVSGSVTASSLTCIE